ncbi:MAG TPA: precorrin-6y C5,15-methyltransferase (decarboxylating) subunit CbiE [Holophaga sp.]|nr:precorrin-6y C5,15-methyltransferase (decarboxylating) subunit CbiE [Holophaga sp.]
MGLIPCILSGCGPGAPDLVTPQVRRAALEASLLAGAPRLLDLFPESQAERLPYDQGLSTFLEVLAVHLGRKPVTVLVSGDPGIASLAGTLERRFPHLPFRRLPGISSLQLAFAEAGLDWMEARMIRAHGSLPPWEETWNTHRGPFGILAGAEDSATFTAELATRLGRSRIWRCERLGLGDQRVTRLTPAELAREGCDPLSVLIVEGETP